MGGSGAPRQSGKREKEAALVVETRGSVGVQDGVRAPQTHCHPHPAGWTPPPIPSGVPPLHPTAWGRWNSAGGVTSPQNTHRTPKPHGDDPPQSLPADIPVVRELGVPQLPWGDPRDTPTHRGVESQCHPPLVSPPIMDWGVPETPTHHGMGSEVPPSP